VTTLPPLAVDIDGTLTDDERRLDPRVFTVIRKWASEAPVVVATGKALPYPVGLCEFLAVPISVVAENGGVVYVAATDTLRFTGDREAAEAVAREYEAAGHSLGWGEIDFVNRWRETEIAVALDQPEAPLREAAANHGMRVIDTGFAFHVTSPDVNKARGLTAAAEAFDRPLSEFAAVGDSENDAEMFGVVGESYAVANADETALAAADHVTEARFADGFIEAIDAVRAQFGGADGA
jgi:phosphoglycolate phosphatase (TIGR01487 family)